MQLTHDTKGFPGHYSELALCEVGQQGWNLLRGDLPLPLAVLKNSALEHNLAWMREFCADRGIDIAPHGKTTMSPELYARQLAAGAWGISFATVFQAGVGARHGVERLLIANQVLQASDLDTLSALMIQFPRLQAFFLVDSQAQLELIEQWQDQRGSTTVFNVLLELGIEGKRTGCRNLAQAMELALSISRSRAVRLCGVECYEGALVTCHHEDDQRSIDTLMHQLLNLAVACDERNLFETDEVLVTAGGSGIFDLVAKHLKPKLKRPTRGILRSGCYLTHDHVHYRQLVRCIGQRLRLQETLRPALEVLSVVQSCPEPGLALLAMGKRDVSFDLDMPIALWRLRGQDASDLAEVPSDWTISALNDQHAYLRYTDLAEAPRVGEVVGCGISHPCTTFDKWRWMPVVDDNYRVIDGVSLHF